MARLAGCVLAKRLVPYIRQFSVSSRHFCNATGNSLPERLHSKILYSSFVEDQKPKLGYRRNRALDDAQRKYDREELLSRVDVRPFPCALKALVSNDEVNSAALNKPQQVTREKDEKRAVNYRTHAPDNWMTDYELYDSDDEEGGGCSSGTPDPNVPPSKIPCSGCGGVLHCADPGIPGYIPSEIFCGRTDAELKTIICQRCHFLKTYNVALDVAVPPEDYIKTLRSIESKHALAIIIVDLLDFPCSIWPGIQTILGSRRPVFVVGNKVDLLPRDSPGYLSRVKDSLTRAITTAGIEKMNIKHVALISAKTGYGIEELITQLQKIWRYDGDVYLVGCTNVGKSTLFNALLGSDYCKSQATDLIQKATTCPWPGTTLQMLKFPIMRPSDIRLHYRAKRLFSERYQRQMEEQLRREQLRSSGKPETATLMGHIGRTFLDNPENTDPFSMSRGTNPILTLNERDKAFVNSKWCYDTPGVVHPDQIVELLTTEEIIQATPSKIIQPQPFLMKPGMSLFISGLARLCFVDGQCNFIRVHVFTSSKLPILIAATEAADEIYETLRGTEYLPVPQKDDVRGRQWPGLEAADAIKIRGKVEDESTCDIVLSSAGWIALEIPEGEVCTFRAWTPQKRGIYIRNPALIAQTNNVRGARIRGSLAYRKKVHKFK